MPAPRQDYGNLPVPDISTYVSLLDRRVSALQTEVDRLFSPSGGGFVPGANIDLAGHDLINFGKLVPQTNIVIGYNASGTGDNASAIGNGAVNTIPHTLVLGDSAIVGIRPMSASGCDLGTSGNRFANINASGNLIGASSTRAIDNIVSTASSGVLGNLPTFFGGKVLQDSGIALSSLATASALASYLPLAGGTMAGALAMGGQNITNVGNLTGPTNSRAVDNIVSCSTAQVTGDLLSWSASSKVATDSGLAAANVITNAANGVVGDLASWSGSKTVVDSGIVAANVITNAANGVTGDLASWSGSKTIVDSGIPVSSIPTSRFSSYLDSVVASTTVETILSNATGNGSLVFAPTLPLGMVIRMKMTFSSTSVAGDLLTIRVKSQAGTLASRAVVVAALANLLPTTLTLVMTVRASSLYIESTLIQSGILPLIQIDTPAFDRTISNTLSVTGQWALAASTCTLGQLTVSTEFR